METPHPKSKRSADTLKEKNENTHKKRLKIERQSKVSLFVNEFSKNLKFVPEELKNTNHGFSEEYVQQVGDILEKVKFDFNESINNSINTNKSLPPSKRVGISDSIPENELTKFENIIMKLKQSSLVSFIDSIKIPQVIEKGAEKNQKKGKEPKNKNPESKNQNKEKERLEQILRSSYNIDSDIYKILLQKLKVFYQSPPPPPPPPPPTHLLASSSSSNTQFPKNFSGKNNSNPPYTTVENLFRNMRSYDFTLQKIGVKPCIYSTLWESCIFPYVCMLKKHPLTQELGRESNCYNEFCGMSFLFENEWNLVDQIISGDSAMTPFEMETVSKLINGFEQRGCVLCEMLAVHDLSHSQIFQDVFCSTMLAENHFETYDDTANKEVLNKHNLYLNTFKLPSSGHYGGLKPDFKQNDSIFINGIYPYFDINYFFCGFTLNSESHKKFHSINVGIYDFLKTKIGNPIASKKRNDGLMEKTKSSEFTLTLSAPSQVETVNQNQNLKSSAHGIADSIRELIVFKIKYSLFFCEILSDNPKTIEVLNDLKSGKLIASAQLIPVWIDSDGEEKEVIWVNEKNTPTIEKIKNTGTGYTPTREGINVATGIKVVSDEGGVMGGEMVP